MIDTNLKKMPSFNKKLLDELKRKHNVTMDQIIKQIKPKKEFSNWKVKIVNTAPITRGWVSYIKLYSRIKNTISDIRH